MNKLSTADRVRVIAALVEGCSIRATVRMTSVAKNTIAKLLVELGAACEKYHDENVRGLKCERVQCDEIWSFFYAKAKNVPDQKRDEFAYGDVWTWTAIDADTKLVVGWVLGTRDASTAHTFLHDIAGRIEGRIHLTSDAHPSYPCAAFRAFDGEVDYAQLVKIYGQTDRGNGRYSPPECIGVKVNPMYCNPDPKQTNTRIVECQNPTPRTSARRFTCLPNAFSKKAENHAASVALHFMHYNFCRIHQTLPVTPAMAAGLTDHVWELEELVSLLG